jgi:hypothetical protein
MASRALSWRVGDTSTALLNAGKMVWQHVHDPNVGKPWMRFGLLNGDELTRPWPIPKDYRPGDHPHHKALWFSWKFINRVNIWERNHKGMLPTRIEVKRADGGAAALSMDVTHGPEGKPPVAKEKRTISVSAPDANGEYHIDWKGVFTPAGAKDVVLNKHWYGGFAWRGAGEIAGEGWRFFDHEGRTDDKINRQAARWVAVSGKTPSGREATVAIFPHPSNPRHPPHWCVIKRMPYFNPVFTAKGDHTLKPGTSLTLLYRLLVTPHRLDADAVEARWKAFAKTKNQDAKQE